MFPKISRPSRNATGRVLSLIAVLLVLGACSNQDTGETEGLQVVATTSVLGDFASGVLGDGGEVDVLMPPGTDPHDFQPSSQDLVAINDADLVIANGLGLEAGLADSLDSARADGARILEIGPEMDPTAFDGGVCDISAEGGKACDPHVWMDPVRLGLAVDALVEQLGLLDESTDWAAAGESYRSELADADQQIAAIVATVPSGERTLVTNHDSLGYFADRYGFEVVGTVIPGGSTLADPSSSELAALVNVVRESGVNAIFAETTESTTLAEALASEAGGIVVVQLFTGSLGGPGSGAESLPEMLITNAMLIVEGLK